MLRKMFLLFMALGLVQAADFVVIHGGTLRPGIRIDDFELLDHPVTNAEYKLFVADAHHAAPPYWENGNIPAGMENRPVVFVSRSGDVTPYLKWRTAREGRIYRLPSAAEFEYAACAGKSGTQFPWGAQPADGSRANFKDNPARNFSQWRTYLKPVKSYPANAWGLYDMAGNVFQMAMEDPDVSLGGFVYRVNSPDDRERIAMGGSWARGEYYLHVGVRTFRSDGIRHPDLGFRVAREPEGATHFHRLNRGVLTLPAGGGKVFIGWKLLPQDAKDTRFNVYRSQYRDAAGEKVTPQPVQNATNFVDPTPPGKRAPRAAGGPTVPDGQDRVYYRVRAVAADGKEGPPSEWAGVEPAAERSTLLAVYQPNVKRGGFVPLFGDIDGDGVMDAVFKLDNGIREMSADPGVPVELEAFTSYGKSIWRRPLVDHGHSFGNANNVPALLYDLDGDGKAEVVVRLQEGNEVYLAVLDGLTGNVLRKTPWTPMVSDFSRSSTRIHLAIAYLDGKHPSIITQSGLYENEIYTAYDANLKQLWQYKSFGETSGSGSHYIVVADVDGDGRDEVFDGSTCLNPDGTVRWSAYTGHPDIIAVKHILPGRAGRQVYFAVEDSTNAGAYLFDAKSGELIWKLNREDDPRWVHAHTGWAADIFEGSPGLEMLTNRDGHPLQDQVLFASDGKILLNPFPRGWRPVNWQGGAVRDLMSLDGLKLGRFTGKAVETLPVQGPNPVPGGVCNITADIAGDFRDEVICTAPGKNGQPALYIYTNVDPIGKRDVTRMASHEYQMWFTRNLCAGYGSYFEWQP